MKNHRILDIYLRLSAQKEVNRKKLAEKYKVSERSIHRDISDLRNFLKEYDLHKEIIYDEESEGYILKEKLN